jgi:acyl-CoA-dependent ceramide synthase
MQPADCSPICEKESEKIEAQESERESENEHEIENGENISEIGGKMVLAAGNTERFLGPKMAVKKKTKQKDEGPLEIVCGWIVEHQIGRRTDRFSPIKG